ncbi:MAG TPA: peptidoglycan-binding protein [Propionibacteriaceae bacterium]|nr:peptidoglycan-binding protein [Propionibacteriaceae bacterium]
MVRFRGAAVVVTAVAVTTALLSGCDVLSIGAPGPAPSTGSATTAPAAEKTTTAATPEPSATPSNRPKAKPKPKPTPSETRPAALMAPGDKGEKVRELQHRLRQLEWYAGSITGTYARSTTKGVKGFQGKRKFPVTGEVDERTWSKLVAMTRTPSRAERHNVLVAGPALMKPGSSGLAVRGLQARLKQIGWYAAAVTGSYGPVTTSGVRGFQAKRGIPVTGSVDQRTLDRLRNMTRTPTNAELYNKVPKPSASGLDPRCLTGRAICVSKRTNSLVWVVDGQPRLRMDVRFGSDRTPTREGSFRVGWKSRHHFSSLYDTSMPYAMFFSGGQAVHYSPDFAAHGYNGASHGCVNVRNLGGIQALFASARVGDKVIVYR